MCLTVLGSVQMQGERFSAGQGVEEAAGRRETEGAMDKVGATGKGTAWVRSARRCQVAPTLQA